MNMDEIVTFIQSVGFPIAVSVYLLWYNNKMSEMHKAEMDSLKDALNANTMAISKIDTLMRDVCGLNKRDEDSKDEDI